MRLKRLQNVQQFFKKKLYIKDLYNRKLLVIATKSAYSIIDFKTLITLETRFETLELNNNANFIYIPGLGLYEEKDNNLINISNNEIFSKNHFIKNVLPINIPNDNQFINKQKEKREKEINTFSLYKSNAERPNFPKLDYVGNNKFNVSHVVPNAWWFSTRNNYEKSGYIDYQGNGLCEYVALSQLLLYNHLFVDSTIFSKLDYDKYFILKDSEKDINDSSPVFRFAKHNLNNENVDNSLAFTLFKEGGYNYDLKTSSVLWNTTEKILKNNINNWKLDGKYGGYYKAWEYVKKGIPSVLTTALGDGYGHSYLVYGYDDNSDMFLVSECFPNKSYTTTLYSYWNFAWGSHFFTIESTKENKSLKKLFSYKNKLYDGKEITKIVEEVK
nr:hypothetical protein [Mycoplasmopsis felis]